MPNADYSFSFGSLIVVEKHHMVINYRHTHIE